MEVQVEQSLEVAHVQEIPVEPRKQLSRVNADIGSLQVAYFS